VLNFAITRIRQNTFLSAAMTTGQSGFFQETFLLGQKAKEQHRVINKNHPLAHPPAVMLT
jgi:hypothetical protein